MIGRIESRTHRRLLKSHLPLDGLPLYDEARYIHVARDGRDACMSFHNHAASFTPEMVGALSKTGLEDPAIGRPYPAVVSDPAEFPPIAPSSVTGI